MQTRAACLTARLSCAKRSFAGIHLTGFPFKLPTTPNYTSARKSTALFFFG